VNGAWAGDLARTATLASVGTRGSLTLARALVRNARANRREPAGAVAAAWLPELLVSLGPAAVKAGQLLGTRADLLPPVVTTALASLYEDLPPPPPGTLAAAFRRDLGVDPSDVLAYWEDAPVAVGSIASVHRAWLHDGTPVAVKVVRPGVPAMVTADLRILRRVARLARATGLAARLPLVEVVDEVCACVGRQTDLRAEADACRELGRVLAPEAGVEVPGLVDPLCGPSVLTMAYVEKRRTHGFVGADLDAAAMRALLRALYRMIFVAGVVHCDLHPGNWRRTPAGQVAVLDFGFTARLTPEDRVSFAQLFYAIWVGDGAACAQIALRGAQYDAGRTDLVAFEREVTAVVSPAAGATVREFSIVRFVGALFAAMRRHRVRGSPGFVMAIMALLTLEGVVRQVDADLDFQAEALPYLFRASLRKAEAA